MWGGGRGRVGRAWVGVGPAGIEPPGLQRASSGPARECHIALDALPRHREFHRGGLRIQKAAAGGRQHNQDGHEGGPHCLSSASDHALRTYEGVRWLSGHSIAASIEPWCCFKWPISTLSTRAAADLGPAGVLRSMSSWSTAMDRTALAIPPFLPRTRRTTSSFVTPASRLACSAVTARPLPRRRPPP